MVINMAFCITTLPDVNVFQVTAANRAKYPDGSANGPDGKALRAGWYWAQFYPHGYTQGPFASKANAVYAAVMYGKYTDAVTAYNAAAPAKLAAIKAAGGK